MTEREKQRERDEPTKPETYNEDLQVVDFSIVRKSDAWNRGTPVDAAIAEFKTHTDHYAVAITRDGGDVHSVIYDPDIPASEAVPSALEEAAVCWCNCKGYKYNGYCSHVVAVHRNERDEPGGENAELGDY